MDKKTTMETWFREVWTYENEAMIHKMFVPEQGKSATGLKKDNGIGPDEFVSFQKALLALLKDVSVEMDSFLEIGDHIAAECTMYAKDRKTGKISVAMKGAVFGKIVDGKIKSASNCFDFLNLFDDLGLLPNNTFATCLGGGVIGN